MLTCKRCMCLTMTLGSRAAVAGEEAEGVEEGEVEEGEVVVCLLLTDGGWELMLCHPCCGNIPPVKKRKGGQNVLQCRDYKV